MPFPRASGWHMGGGIRALLPAGAMGSLLLAAGGQAHAQESGGQAPDAEITVTGEGLSPAPGTAAYGAVLVARSRLVEDASGRLEDVLKDVAGFQQFRRSDSRSANPTAQGVTLRALGGNAASRTLVLLDGVPIADPFFGYVPFNAIDPARLGGVRVTRGSGVGAFGPGAVAGTIELISAARRDLPTMAADGSLGGDDAVNVSASVSPDLGGGFASVSGRFERGDGFYTTPPDQRTAATVRAAYRDWSGMARMVAPIDADTDLRAGALVFRDDRVLRFRGANSTSGGEDVNVGLVHRGRWPIEAIAYAQLSDYTNKVISAATARLTLDQRATPAMGLGGKIEVRPPIGSAHTLRLGGDLRAARGDAFEDAYAGSGAITVRRGAGGRSAVGGLFVEDSWTAGRLVVTGGGRVDRWSLTHGYLRETGASGSSITDASYAARHGTEATGRAGLSWRIADGLTVRATGYTGYRLPTLNELYRPFVVFPVTTQANPALKPERLRGIEGGIELAPAPGLVVTATVFHNRLDDAIANLTIGPNLRRRGNVAAIAATGLEASIGWRLGAFGLNGSYALVSSRVRAPGAALDGHVPAQTARNNASATVSWRARRAALSATLRYVGAQYEDDLGVDRLPPATTVDVFASTPLAARITGIVRVENASDMRVVTRNQAGSLDLGVPRTLWVEVRIAG